MSFVWGLMVFFVIAVSIELLSPGALRGRRRRAGDWDVDWPGDSDGDSGDGGDGD